MKISFQHHSDNFYVGPWGFLARVIVMSLGAVLAGYLLPGVTFGSLATVVVAAVVISLLNNFIRPILIVVTLPFTIFTLGFFLLVINALMIELASAIVADFHVATFGDAFLFSLLLTLFNYLLELPNRMMRRRRYQPTHDDSNDEGFTPYEEVE